MEYWGNQEIFKLHKIAYLCSQRCSASVVLRSYDWAKAQREAGNCIVCGNHSQIEKDVFEILLRGGQPLILMLARGMKKRWEPEIEKAVLENRLLVISPFPVSNNRVTRENAATRNREMIRLCDQIVIGYVSKGGQLEGLLENKMYELI